MAETNKRVDSSNQFSSACSDVYSGDVHSARAEVKVEIVVDFGLFELLVASGLAALGRAINRRPIARTAVLVVSLAAPAALLGMVRGESLRWIAALALGTSLVNTSIILGAVRERATRTGA